MAELSEIERIIGEAERATSAGDHAAAERALRRVLRLQEAGLGLSHPDVANTLNDLAVVCERLGRPDEAEFLYRRALGIARRTLEPDHPYIATSLENLSNLYQAQGKPEKLAKIREGRSPGSGLPELGGAEKAVEKVAAAEEMAGPETAEPVPVSAVESDQHQDSRPHPMFRMAIPPAFLTVGAAVVLILTLWLLFSRTVDPGLPGEDGAGTRLQASGGDPSAGTADPAEGTVSGPSAVVTAPPGVATAVDPDDAQAAPAPGDGGDGIGSSSASLDRPPPTVSDTPPEPVERPDPSPAPGLARSSVVAEAEVCSQLDTRSADGVPLAEWSCQPVVDRATPGRLFFYTRIRSRTSTTVEHRWLRNGVIQQQVTLDIQANDGPGYRTYSSQTVSPDARGSWRVELRLSDPEPLHVQEFVVP